MNKILFIFLLPLLVFANTIFNEEELLYIENKKTILVSNEYDYEPYDYNIDGKALGFSIELLELILKDTGLKIKYITKPWDELLKDLQNNKLDLIHTIYKTQEREKIFSYSIGYSKSSNNYITRKDTNNISSVKDLFGKKVGISKSWSDEVFFNNYPKITKVYYESLEDKLKALSVGEIDAIINSANVANYYIKKYGYNLLKVNSIIKDEFANKLNDHYFVSNIDNPILISIINKSYKSLSLDQIIKLNQKWFGEIDSRIDLTIEEQKYLNEKVFINLCIDPNWKPLEFFNKDGKHDGMSSDYFKLFSKILDVDFNVINSKSWNQTLSYVKNKKCDIVSFAMETKNRKEYLNFTTPYLELPLVVATKNDIPFIEDIEYFIHKPIGVIKNYAVGEILKEKYPEMNIVEVKDMQEAMRKLSKGEIFGYIDTLPTISAFFQSSQNNEIKIAGKVDLTWELGIAVRNDDKLLLEILEKVITKVTQEEKREILNKWISIKYEKATDYKLVWKILAISVLVVLLFIYRQYLLRRSLNDFTKLIDSTLEAIIIFKNNKCIDANKSALKIFDYDSKNSIKGKSIYDFISDKSKTVLQNKINNSINIPFELFAKKSSSKDFNALINYYEIKDKNIFVLSVVDITNLKELEASTKRAQMGEMIENIAHQWRQPLSTISTVASNISFSHKMDIKQDMNYVALSMDKIVKTTTYLSDTINTFQNFLKEKKELKKVVLQDRIKIATDIVAGSLINYNIELKKQIPSEPMEIYLYAGELSQVLINILNNAKDVIKHREIENPWIEIKLEKCEEKVKITIEDNAQGIEDNIINKIFDPYFTTKHSSQGTGLGLHMSYRIITESLKGKLSVSNTKNGALFTIELPVHKS